jgi:hypothetical protein
MVDSWMRQHSCLIYSLIETTRVQNRPLPTSLHSTYPSKPITNCTPHLSPGVFVPGADKGGGRAPHRDDLEVLPPELGGHGELLPALPARLPLAELRHHRRVVRYLTPHFTSILYRGRKGGIWKER